MLSLSLLLSPPTHPVLSPSLLACTSLPHVVEFLVSATFNICAAYLLSLRPVVEGGGPVSLSHFVICRRKSPLA